MVQLREKEMPPRELLTLARDLRELTATTGTVLIINDRVEIAALCGADGAHQGQDDLAPTEVRKILGPDAIVGISTHAGPEASEAERAGAGRCGDHRPVCLVHSGAGESGLRGVSRRDADTGFRGEQRELGDPARAPG